MLSLPKLITTEEVYDLDVFELKDVLNIINNTQTDDPSWNKKAFKLKDLITQELQERDAIENFAFKIDYASILQQNDTLKAILDDIKNRPPNYLDQFGAIKDQQIIEQKIEQKREPISRQNDLSNSTVSHVTNITNNLKIQKKKKDGLLDFMKDVLKKTDVGDQKFFIGQATQGRYVPPAPKPKQTTVEKIKADHVKQKKKRKEKLEKLEQRSSSVINQKSRASQQSVDTKSSKLSTQVSSASKPKEDVQQKEVIENHIDSDNLNNLKIVQSSVNQQIVTDQNYDQQSQIVQINNQNSEQENTNNKSQILIVNKINENTGFNTKFIQNDQIQQNASFQKLKKSIVFSDEINNKHQNISQPQQQMVQNSFQQQFQQNNLEIPQLSAEIKIQQNNEKIKSQQPIKNYSQTNPISQNHQIYDENEDKNQGLNNQQDIDWQISQKTYQKNQTQQINQKQQTQYNDIIHIEETKQAYQNESQISAHSRENDNFVIKTIKDHPHQFKQLQSPKQKDLQPIQLSNNQQMPTQRQEIDEEIAEDFNEQEDESDQEPVKIKLQKQLVGKVVQVAQKKQFIEIKYENKQQQKEEKKDKNKLEDIKKLCDEMDLKEFMPKDDGKQKKDIQQNSKPSSQQTKKPRVPLAPQAPPKQNVQSKFISKMMTIIDDSKLIDYSDIIPTFQSLFSGFYLSQPNYNHLDAMREIHSIFSAHIDKVDNVDQLLYKYKLNIFNPNELQYINDPKKLVVYASKTNIDIQQFIQRQMMFNQRLQNEDQKSDQYFRVIKTKEEVYDIITRSFMRKLGWSELPHGAGLKTSWNVLWTWSKPQIDLNKLILFQKVNHFSFNKNLARKDLLKKNIERCQKLGQKTAQLFDIIPTTFLLPKEYVQFVERFYKDQETEGQYNIWIMKPTSKSRGRGITVINDVSEVMYAEPVVLQKYLKNPLLIKGHKFDMRIYVLVTQFNPLEAFLYKEGFARLTTEPFTLDINDLKNTFVHLTNFAVQKHNVHQPQDFEQQFGGSKLSLRQLKEKLQDKLDWNNIWDQVQDIIVKSLCATQSEIPHNPNSFELFGYDIIIDTNHKCWLLEVNSSPSLARDYVLDELVKQQLIDDIFDLIQPIHFDRQRLCEVLERRILEEQGCKSAINTLNNSRLQVSRDINYILRGQKIRKYGEMPQNLGGFQRIAPSDRYERYKNLLSNYKTVNGRGTID